MYRTHECRMRSTSVGDVEGRQGDTVWSYQCIFKLARGRDKVDIKVDIGSSKKVSLPSMTTRYTMSLLSSHKASDSGLTVQLHPLVLLTISDYITRHTLRRQEPPIVGALLGRQSGRSVSLEHAFDLQTVVNGEEVNLHDDFFKERLQQYKDVHQAPQLDLVGWFTTAPVAGPEAIHGALHEYILQNHNETAVLLAFHPSGTIQGNSAGAKLPLTIYESLYESIGDSGEAMDTGEQEGRLELRFRELPYSIETGEAEMISVDFVARGGGNATAVEGTEKKQELQNGDAKGKRVAEKEVESAKREDGLSPEDEERGYNL